MIKLKRARAFLASLIMLAGVVSARQATDPDSVMAQFMRTWNVRGGSAAISKKGKVILSKGFGSLDSNKTRPASASSLYRIASISKPITSMAIMKLVEEGRLSLDDTVFGKGKILDQPYYTEVIRDRRLSEITVRQLLEHTAGWDRTVGVDGFSHSDAAFFPLHVANIENAPNPVGDSTIIRFSLRTGLQHDPGENFCYSNVGYLVLGKVIEKISGQMYDSFVNTALLEPLGITGIKPGKNLRASHESHESEYFSSSYGPSCYGDNEKVPVPYGMFNLEAMNAHGGWIATAESLVKLLLATDGYEEVPDVLTLSSIIEMTTPGSANPRYAKGWFVNQSGSWWHVGSLEGTAAFVCRTSSSYTCAFLFNGRGDNSPAFWADVDKLPWKMIAAMSAPASAAQ